MRLVQFSSYLLPIVAAPLAAPVIVGTAYAQANTACQADFTGDGVVNFGDFAVFKSVFFQFCLDLGPICGDAVAQGPEEQCDDGNRADGDGCSSACTIELPLPGNAVLATGQTTCWRTAGSEISCAGTAHDGDLQKGTALAYVDNGDGTITDSNTSLMWEKLSDDGTIHDWNTTYTWDDAFSLKIPTLNEGGGFAGHTDWRLPNRRELDSIVNLQNTGPAVSAVFHTGCVANCTVMTCSCTRSQNYWSSSSYANGGQFAWYVYFFNGDEDAYFKTSKYHVRAVRGGP